MLDTIMVVANEEQVEKRDGQVGCTAGHRVVMACRDKPRKGGGEKRCCLECRRKHMK